jgi:hypothetical protein
LASDDISGPPAFAEHPIAAKTKSRLYSVRFSKGSRDMTVSFVGVRRCCQAQPMRLCGLSTLCPTASIVIVQSATTSRGARYTRTPP